MSKLLPGKKNNFNDKNFNYLAKPTDYLGSSELEIKGVIRKKL